MSRPKINRIKLNRRDINIRQVYVTIRHIASESDENYKEISIMVLIFVDKDSALNMTKGALILSLSFLLAACSSIPQNIKGNNQPDIQKVLLLFITSRVICWSTSALWWEGYQRYQWQNGYVVRNRCITVG